MMQIEGVATCDQGTISIRVYEKEGEEETFRGTATGFIDGHVISAMAQGIEYTDPNAIMIRYAIQPM